jgi:aldose 1-epimerase
MKVTGSVFGTTAQGEEVTQYRIENSKGAYITVLDYGAVLKDIVVLDKAGSLTDVALGFDTVAEYEKNPTSFGATIGRNANRIEGATFNLDGMDYALELNEKGKNNLHSGPDGYQFRMWSAKADEKNGCVTFSLVSPDGDQGFPGTLQIAVTYMFTENNKVKIHYEGTCDANTIVNMTNHSYFNLNGEGNGSIYDHLLSIDADCYTPVDTNSIPYGTSDSVEGTPFDFRAPKMIGTDAGADDEQLMHTSGYDHNFVLNGTGLRNVAKVSSSLSGISMTIMTDQPGMQFYAGNFINGISGKSGHIYANHTGAAFETQHFPNSINVLAFESPKLGAGDRYSTTTCYQFETENAEG